jgi:stage III sporulation protein AE
MSAAKYAASGMIPVVGSTVAGALSTLASGLSYAKGIIGVGAIVVIVGIIISPLVLLLLHRLALSLALILADFLGVSGASRIFGAFRASFDSLIAVYALCSVLYIFNAVLFMKSGVALL